MQWDTSEFAGFSEVEPWLPIAHNFREENVDNARGNKCSLYWLYRRLINERRNRVLSEGSYRPVATGGDLLLFFRELEDERVLIALNLGSKPIAVSFPAQRLSSRVLVSSFADRDGEEVRDSIDLRCNEGLLVKMRTDPTGTLPMPTV
jgi:alpha-glucosidase